MEVDTLLGAFKDFEKNGKKEVCHVLDQFLSHIAKTGETLIQWPQFKSYFLFKLEKVMDDFRASSPEQPGPANPNVEYVTFDEMKDRILKIVDGYTGIPFTIQRLCELLTEPKRNYTGTDKFLRGVEKNVMVVSCVYSTSEKNSSSGVNRMNGVMFPGNSSVYTDRNVNGPSTPWTLSRPKQSPSSSVSTNGIPDSTESTDTKEGENDICESSASEVSATQSNQLKKKHTQKDEDSEDDRRDMKKLKFDEDEGTVNNITEDQEPSSTQTEALEEDNLKTEKDEYPEPSQSLDQIEQSELFSQPAKAQSVQQGGEDSDPVSSSDGDQGESSEEPACSIAEDHTETTPDSLESTGDAMDQE
ncbi:serine/threonine-protein phosphatase 4 regulatory subunit 2-A-like isoform X1 [Denticeps clupeoides]|uniref:serine/threonine-protein phosphatase 4 regulatory subunit 2-A-like isoform X1 n=1 Tax=Denticeps clupeoides TaxID=299321 RepID=UPI0010A3A94E|nr:serine/threonine-protein phosphatase 4 regulatory subunit 2-A-like isoform X1 [Denticeps clupeoides]XP_028850346.1 serine/threonine-protein phosphatase 4 regulatory subunit 2-A-like isoform X1 [Denticeps clupeoides]